MLQVMDNLLSSTQFNVSYLCSFIEICWSRVSVTIHYTVVIINGEYHCISSVHTNKASMLNNRGSESLDAMQQTCTLRSESSDLINIALLMKKESSFWHCWWLKPSLMHKYIGGTFNMATIWKESMSWY